MKDFTGKSINANYLEGVQILTGKLHFYEDRYVFKAYAVNAIINKGEILYKNILDVKVKNMFGFIPNALVVYMDDGNSMIYVIRKRKEIKRFLLNKSAYNRDENI